jgi:hypothetical protein
MYCSWCGNGMSQEQWRAIYCWRCGAKLMKGGAVELGAGTGSGAVLSAFGRSAPTRRVQQTLRVAAGTVKKYPLICSVAAIGVGAGCIAVAPALLAAGSVLMWVGAGIAVVSGWFKDEVYEVDLEGGVKLGLGMAGIGAVVYGSSYVLLAAGGISIAAGVGGCVYVGTRMGIQYRQMKRCEVKAPLLLKKGGSDESGEDR